MNRGRNLDAASRVAPDPFFVELRQLRVCLPGLCTGRSIRSGSFLLLSLEEIVQVVHSGPKVKRRARS